MKTNFIKVAILCLVSLFAGGWFNVFAQTGWIAPEGFTVNYRTLTWDDFKGKEDKDVADQLAAKNLQAEAYVSPAIYFTADSGYRVNDRVKFRFHIKCAFQSLAFVRRPTQEEHSTYVLNHEQDHYDISLIFANKLQNILAGKDFSEDKDKRHQEMDQTYTDLIAKYDQTQTTYDGEVNPNGTDDKPKQALWDKRIRKCMENNTDQFLSATEESLQGELYPGTIVKRIPGEPALQFVVRARPIYTEFTTEAKAKIVETTEWSESPAVIAFYTQKYYTEENATVPNLRTLAYIFMPTANEYYKRILVDTFCNDDKPVKINKVFFANADSDATKELVIMASSAQSGGAIYYNRIYDNVVKPMPAKLRRIPDAKTKITGGFDGMTRDGKTGHVEYKTKDDILEALKSAGFR